VDVQATRLSGPLLSPATTIRNLVCPNKEKLASIRAAKFHGEDADWSVVECSLLPSGEVKCAMSCLWRAHEFDSSK
jgi:hypothetical protein